MTQCVPNWDLDDSTSNSARQVMQANPTSDSTAPDVPMLDYEVAELTWENGQLAMHCLGPQRVTGKPLAKYTWEKPRVGGTLEAVVKQATLLKPCTADEIVPWFDHHRPTAASLTMDALVPSSNRTNSIDENSNHVPVDKCFVGSSTRVGSCSGAAPSAPFHRGKRDERTVSNKRTRLSVRGRIAARKGSSFNQSASGSDTFGRESTHVSLDTLDTGIDVGFTSTSLGSPDNTSSGKPITIDDHDSVSNRRSQREGGGEDEKRRKKKKKKEGEGGRSSVSTKRCRAAAVHNQSERKRRDRINQRMKTLQKMVPNSSKTDKASMLDEVIEYLKQLQAQIQMMSRMNNIPQMMMPMAMQQLQMSMMAQMGMGMGMGMGMPCVIDMNRLNSAGIPPMMHPAAAFLPFPTAGASWEGSGDRLPSSGTVLPDPFSAFLACQTPSMNMDGYNRMAALYQQYYQNTQSNAKT